MEDTKWGFGFSHFLGAAFRYKVFQVGAEYNFAHLKSVTWFEDDEDPVNNTVNSISETKTKFDNLRIFLGFKF
jgi:hypothetical protein